MNDTYHSHPDSLATVYGCPACLRRQRKRREQEDAYSAAVRLEYEQQRIERESLTCDAVSSSLATGCA